MSLFYIFWKHQIIEGFLVFSGRIKWKISRSWVNSLDKQTDFKYFQATPTQASVKTANQKIL